jgi:hypothetical protein
MGSVKINNFEILNDGQQLAIDVETAEGSLITSIQLWNNLTFKDYSKSFNLTYKLEQINNKEVFLVNAEELNIKSFDDIWFTEITSNYVSSQPCTTCQDPALGITYNLQPYYKCMLNYLLNFNKSVKTTSINTYDSNLVVVVNLLIDGIQKSIEVGYYTQAIEMLNDLKKICNISKCKNCETVACSSCSKFTQQ